jgi:malonyl-CoA O-methyltransferase
MNGDRQSVRGAFGRAATRYDSAAVFQREVGRRLLARLGADLPPRRILDIGCGTGHGVGLLADRWPEADILTLDFALPMLRQMAQPAMARICADAEAVPLADASIDLLWSNLTLQWCDPTRFAREAARLLRPGGRLAASTLGPGTFAELRRAFAAADGYRHTIEFRDEAELTAAFAAAGLCLRVVERAALTRRHDALRPLLAEVRDIGANRVGGNRRRRSLMGKAAWAEFAAAYEAQRGATGLPLTYDTLFLYAEK